MTSKNIILKSISNRLSLQTPWKWGKIALKKPLRADRFMALDLETESQSAMMMGESLENEIMSSLGLKNRRKTLVPAIAAIVGDLLVAKAESDDLYSFRPLGAGEFAGERIGYKPCKVALDGLMQLDLLHRQDGFKCFSDRAGKGQATRFQAKPDLLAYALRYGITPGNWQRHFRQAPRSATIANPVMVRGIKQYWHKAPSGPKLPLSPKGARLDAIIRQVQEINAFMATQSITGCEHRAFRRIFGCGDQTGFNWNKAGRLYSVGVTSYQNIEKEKRQDIRINGEYTVEVDISASHITALYCLAGNEIDTMINPYIIDGLPRAVVKAWINMTLGYGQFHHKWPKEVIDDVLEYDGIVLTAFDVSHVRSEVLRRHPILTGWERSPVRWADLQFVESEAVIEAVHTMATVHNVAALPLHDSLIVGRSHTELAERVLKAGYLKHVGAIPGTKVKDGNDLTSVSIVTKLSQKVVGDGIGPLASRQDIAPSRR